MDYETMRVIGFWVFAVFLLGVALRYALPLFLILCALIYLTSGC